MATRKANSEALAEHQAEALALADDALRREIAEVAGDPGDRVRSLALLAEMETLD